MRPKREIDEVKRLLEGSLTHREVSERTGIPVNTIRTWLYAGFPPRNGVSLPPEHACKRCGAEAHRFSELPREAYAYLLGVYLGDGVVSRMPRTYLLRVALDTAYPGIVEEVSQAIATIRGRAPWRGMHPAGSSCWILQSYWNQWPCLFPQHGPGRKHTRAIQLATWQGDLIEADPRPLLRGLIQTDGWRGLNRVCVKGKQYAYPRYQFSNRSDDIRRIFTDACDLLGVDWRPWGRWNISVARNESVAILDEFIGLKE